MERVSRFRGALLGLAAGDALGTTHGSRECVDACRYMGAIIVGALDGQSKNELLAESFWRSLDVAETLAPKIAEIANGSFRTNEPPKICGAGYVVKSLEAALWAFHKSEDFRHGALLAVNLGDDADTTGAVYGQIAGAHYGEDGIPLQWRAKLAMRDLIEQRANELYALSRG
jgi:ADP-ribosyl-[dinitrogen reductase] hydrolase